jgi:hypothetical protein
MALTLTQRAFATSREPFPAFIGGFGSGKTAAAIARAMALKTQFKGCDIAYYLPSFPLVEDIAMRRFPELCERKGWAFKMRGGTSPHIEFPGAGRILFRSLSHPESIVGYEVAHSICDELDTLPKKKARDAWNKVIARNRQKCAMANTVAVATTPEGFQFVYERWQKQPAPGYVMFKARTIENAANLPPDYIQNLQNSYPSNLLAAYLDGEFVNLAAGSVYHEFDRHLNGTDATIRPGEPLHIGMDFNVNNMSAVVFVIRDGSPLALEEVTQVRDTPTMCGVLVNRYKAAGHSITVYPDASGQATKSVNASLSDLTLLRSAGFTVLANNRNPAVKDRVLAVNQLINNQGTRRLRVNFDKCPTLVEGLEQQAYNKNGEPDKTGNQDHLNDALGYFLCYKFGIARGPVAFAQIAGV